MEEKRIRRRFKPKKKEQQQKGTDGSVTEVKRKEFDGVEEKQQWVSGILPEDLVIESILTRLPVRNLAVCCCVSKFWFNSIFNDSRFSMIHYNQNRSKFFLVFNLLNVSRANKRMNYVFSLLAGEKADIRFLSGIDVENIYEIVGFCNGLACVKQAGAPTDTHGAITVLNPNRGESLVLTYSRPTEGYIYLCHGFGFDSLSQAYKAVIVFASEANNEYLCMVITLGTMSWRKILTSTSDISPPPGFSPFLSPMLTRVSRTICRQATFCGGDLFWKTKNKIGDDNAEIEMLLLFDLHNELIYFIRLPTECASTTVANEQQYLVVDHLLEFKGYPCIARSERITRSNSTHYCSHGCNYLTGVCCRCYKVHMYMLKDKVKQVWTREETFDVQISTPLCQYFVTSDSMPPPTRIVTFSDQVLLYWFNGKHLIFYNLQEKHLKVVECSSSYPGIFQSKMNEDLERRIGDDDNIHCPSMDYQLHAQVENIVSLKTFIPKEDKTVKTADEARLIIGDYLAKGWLSTGRNTPTIYTFS